MKFWDSSAIVGLCLQEPHTVELETLSRGDPSQAVWWATRTECLSALERGVRAGKVDGTSLPQMRRALMALTVGWFEIAPHDALRRQADRIVSLHSLSAADAFQLAAALQWCRQDPLAAEMVVLDRRLREAAQKEGFIVLP